MAAPVMGEANQHLWDETLTSLLSLSSATVKRNLYLENRLAELEVELSVWKQAHAVALEASEREAKAHNVQVAALNKQISELDCFRGNQNPLILCVVNGNENLFIPNLVVQGQQGGRAAAQRLTKTIAEQLSSENVHIFGRLSFWVTIYYCKEEIMDFYVTNNFCTAEQVEHFLIGFSQASPRFSLIDVGPSKDVVDSKIKEYVQTYARFPQTLRLFFAGGQADSSGYLSMFSLLEKDHLLGKLILLRPSTDSETDPVLSTLPRLVIENVFATGNVSRRCFKLPPLTLANDNVTINGGLISPQSPPRSSESRKLIDPSLPLHRQNPPPCNEHYLMTCSKGPGLCKYSHDYVLTPEQLTSLANNAKKAPCNWLKNGVQCPFGERCCWGHVCPNGPKCFHLSKGKCWFKGESMHPPLTEAAMSTSSGKSSPVVERAVVRNALSALIAAQQGIYNVEPRKEPYISYLFLSDNGKQEDLEDLKPTATPGFKLGAEKTAEELAKLDAEDESLNRWKASLGVVPGSASGDASGPKVTVLTLELNSDTLPAGKRLSFDLGNPQILAATKKDPIVIKEGIEYNVSITFKVNHSIISGMRYIQVVKRAGIRVDKLEQMLGSYGPHPQGDAYTKNFDPEESPSGMLARSGSYDVKSRVVDDDGNVYADFQWHFKLAKEW